MSKGYMQATYESVQIRNSKQELKFLINNKKDKI